MSKGLKCRIIKINNKISEVLSSNGVPSKLYDDLVKYIKSKTPSTDNNSIDGEMLSVRERAVFRNNYLLTPRGTTSNLTVRQWELVRTPTFINTFGDWINGESKLALDNNGEPVFNTKNEDSISFWHGGLPSDFNIDELDVMRLASKQQKKGRQYAGFYMYDETQKGGAETYSKQTGQGLHRFDISKSANILELGNIERVSKDKLLEYQSQGVDILKGVDVRGRVEYILLNKDVIINVVDENNSLNEEEVLDFIDRSEYSESIKEQALLLWGLANSDSVKTEMGIIEEPSLNQFLDFFNKNGDGKSLSNIDIDSINSLLNTIDSSLFQHIYEHSKEDGAKILLQHFNNTDLLNQPIEVQTIRDSIAQSLKFVTTDTKVLGEQVISTTTDLWEELDKVYVDKVEQVEDILDLVDLLPNSIAEGVVQNKDVQTKLFNYYVNLEPVQVVNIIDGNVNDVVVDKQADTMSSTLIFNRNITKKLISKVSVLSSLTEDTWDKSVDIIPDVLKELELLSVDLNLDLYGLTTVSNTKSASENISFMKSLEKLLSSMYIGDITQNGILEFKNIYKEFFNTKNSNIIDYFRNNKEFPIVSLVNNIYNSPGVLFNEQSLIRHKGNGYVLVNADALYNYYMTDSEANLPSFLYNSDGKIDEQSVERIGKYFNRSNTAHMFETVDENIKYNMAIYSVQDSSNDMKSDLINYIHLDSPILNDAKGIESLAEFPSKLANIILKEKAKSSKVYNNLLKYFYINDSGIHINGDISTLRQEYNRWSKELGIGEQLEAHSLATNNMELYQLVNNPIRNNVLTPKLIRTLARNGVLSVPEFSGSYNRVNKDTIRTNKYAGEVININGEIMYLENRNTNEYINVPVLDAKENVTNIEFTPSINYIENSNVLNSKQLEEVNNKIDQCS